MNLRISTLAAVLLAGSLSLPLLAQDDAAAEAPAAPVKPRAAEIAPLSARALLLGIARVGEGLVVVGDRGNILLSADGDTWQQVASPVNATLTAVSFLDASTGWAVGHDATILKTSDGGKTWALQNFQPELNKPLLNITPIDAQRAYAVGAYGLFLSTADGGSTWTEVDAPTVLEEGYHLSAIVPLTTCELFLVGEAGLIAVAPADGSTWERLTLPYEGSLFGALPRGARGALVYGLRGNVLVTDDVHSNQWTPVDLGTTQSMFGATTLADGRIALVGADGEIVYLSPDGTVKRAPIATGTAALGSGSLAGVVSWKDGLRVVGEAGVRPVKLTP